MKSGISVHKSMHAVARGETIAVLLALQTHLMACQDVKTKESPAFRLATFYTSIPDWTGK